jgi:glutathione S-transferase
MIKFYDYVLSGNCYKVRLLLKFIALTYASRELDFHPTREHKSAWFLKLNPRGQLPVLEDDGEIFTESRDILVHLARRYDQSGQWYPAGRSDIAREIDRWLTFADALTTSIGAARLHDFLLYDLDADAARREGQIRLEELDFELWMGERRGAEWICTNSYPTIADIACFPYAALAEDAGINLRDYPAVRRWIDRFKALPNFQVMSGIFARTAAEA